MKDARLDFTRAERTGIPEVVFAAGKTQSQLGDIVAELYDDAGFALATRVEEERGASLSRRFAEGRYDSVARCFALGRLPLTHQKVAVVCAGTSDLPVAGEAAFVLDAFGHDIIRQNDVGVAGLHRVLANIDDLQNCCCVIVVAGMEGALPSVVAGLVRPAIIAVPTSVGYGASFGGIAALLGMLNSCAPGVAVVNIDNGFGAAALAHKIAIAAAGASRES